MSRVRVLGLSAALVTAAIAGGAFLDAVVSAAAPSAGSTAPTAAATSTAATAGGAAVRQPSEYCLAFRSALAANLGVTPDQLVAAARKAAGTALDQAVADGKIRQARANRIKARIEAAPATNCRIPAGWRASLERRLAGAAASPGVAPGASKTP
ncbi:MAG: hypothetical protein M3067_06950 [Chloroflexota bacterium]|nr:hypothetical protein [Chloroflexota bacterium]